MNATRVIGIDLGGTKILAGILDRTGRIDNLVERATPDESQDALLDALVEMVDELRSDAIGAVGFGVPARIDPRTGVAFGAVNARLHNVRLAEVMKERLGMPVNVINDGSAAALAEHVYGAGRGAENLVMLALGTGVGGGFVFDGGLYRGWSEAGHMVIVEDGEPCQGACTGHGHVESYCSGHAADRLARDVLGPQATARDLVEQRHPALAQIGKHLGMAIASLINLFGPDVVLIGGGFGVAAGDQLLGPVREVVVREALEPGAELARLGVAELGSNAGLIGAGLVAFEALDPV
jgi:glucokinase